MQSRHQVVLLIAALSVIASSAPLLAQPGTEVTIAEIENAPILDPTKIENLNPDNNPGVSREEFKQWSIAIAKRAVTAKADTSGDGRVDRAEFEASDKTYLQDVKEVVDNDLRTFDLKVARHRTSEAPVPEVETQWPALPPKVEPTSPDAFGWSFVLRKSYDEIAKPLDATNPATLTYTRNFDTDNDVWQTNGVFGAKYRTCWDKSFWVYNGSLAFDRVTNEDDPTKEVNSLIPRLGVSAELPGDSRFFDMHTIRVNGAYATDFDGELRVPAVEVEYEPTIFRLSVGNETRLFNIVDYRWRLIAHGEYRRVTDAGGNPALEAIEDEDSFRFGPKVQLELRPSRFKNFSATLAYSHLNDVSNGTSADLFSALGKYKLDDKGNYYLTVEYRHGDTPLVEQNTNQLGIGIGFKF